VPADVLGHVEAERAELIGEAPGGLGLLEGELGVGVEGGVEVFEGGVFLVNEGIDIAGEGSEGEEGDRGEEDESGSDHGRVSAGRSYRGGELVEQAIELGVEGGELAPAGDGVAVDVEECGGGGEGVAGDQEARGVALTRGEVSAEC
jgi:hypothetical protein